MMTLADKLIAARRAYMAAHIAWDRAAYALADAQAATDCARRASNDAAHVYGAALKAFDAAELERLSQGKLLTKERHDMGEPT